MLPTCSSWHDRLWTPRKGMQGQTDRQTIKSCMSMLYTKYRFWARVQWIYMVGEWQVFTRQWQVVCVFAKNWKRIVCFPRGLTDKKMCRTCRWCVNHIMYSIMYYNIICLELRTWEVEFRSQTLDLAISNSSKTKNGPLDRLCSLELPLVIPHTIYYIHISICVLPRGSETIYSFLPHLSVSGTPSADSIGIVRALLTRG